MSHPGSAQQDLALLRDLLAIEIAEMQARVDGTKPGWKLSSDAWRLVDDHKRKALCMALDFVMSLLRSERPGASGFSACSRNFYANAEPIPRALIRQGFISAGIDIPAEYIADLDVGADLMHVNAAEAAVLDGDDEKSAPQIDVNNRAAHCPFPD
jgi:hypothetical protein